MATVANSMVFADAQSSPSHLEFRLQPKIGLLGMIVDPILNEVVEDAYIVPVSIYYDGDLCLQRQNYRIWGDPRNSGYSLLHA